MYTATMPSTAVFFLLATLTRVAAKGEAVASWTPSCAKNVVVPDGVTSIGDLAFAKCSSLTSITIPESVTSIGEEAFLGSPIWTSKQWNQLKERAEL